MKTKDIVIIGASGLAAEVAFLINEINIAEIKFIHLKYPTPNYSAASGW